MSGILISAIRTGIQSAWGVAAAWLASLGIAVSDEQSIVVTGLLLSLAVTLSTAVIRWLETREGEGWERGARLLGKLLMLGLSGQQPTYPIEQAKR